MAKWGEGDPRWIVEERPDATNVNNWHWTEKNATGWSKDLLRELFLGVVIEELGIGKCWVTEVTELEGEASANNRKAKLIFFYEWMVKLCWKGKMENSSDEYEGKIEIPNISDENEPKEVVINVSTDSVENEAEILKELVRNKGLGVIQDLVDKYIRSLKEQFTQGMILPSKVNTNINGGDNSSGTRVNLSNKLGPIETQRNLGVKVSTKKITMEMSFKCTAMEFYNVLTIKEMVQAFTRSDVVMTVEKGGRFELFGGNIHGVFLELDPPRKIVQSWRLQNWPSGHYSNVTFDIMQGEDSTKVVMTQTEVPSSEVDKTEEGWNKFYFESMKRTFGFGTVLY